MKTKETWLDEYGVCHQNKTNRLIHVFCVPLIMSSIFGLGFNVPIYNIVQTSILGAAFNFFTLTDLIIIVGLIFHARLGFDALTKMLIATAGCLAFAKWIYILSPSHGLNIHIAIFAVSWVFQFIGHKIEGKKPSFLADLQFLLVGPLWVIEEILGNLDKK
jgi:uncharacterized membrane protein YGL010W